MQSQCKKANFVSLTQSDAVGGWMLNELIVSRFGLKRQPNGCDVMAGITQNVKFRSCFKYIWTWAKYICVTRCLRKPISVGILPKSLTSASENGERVAFVVWITHAGKYKWSGGQIWASKLIMNNSPKAQRKKTPNKKNIMSSATVHVAWVVKKLKIQPDERSVYLYRFIYYHILKCVIGFIRQTLTVVFSGSLKRVKEKLHNKR